MNEDKGRCISIRWCGQGGHTLFLYVLKQAWRYAYGPQLAKRLKAVLVRFLVRGKSVSECPTCHIPVYDDGDYCCRYCQRERVASIAGESTPHHHEFFSHIGRYLIALGAPQNAFMLLQLAKIGPHDYCQGCLVYTPPSNHFVDTSGRAVFLCHGHDISTDSAITACSKEWCSPRLMGIARCSMCRRRMCGHCVRQCRVCHGAATCDTCYLKIRCQPCDFNRGEDGNHYCVWHCPPRHPYALRGCGNDIVQLVCDAHRQSFDEWDRITRECLQCDEYRIPINCCVAGCKTEVCPHSEAWGDGDERCEPCRRAKRARNYGNFIN